MGFGPLIMFRYEEITSIHLEISSLCNAACPDCPRNLRGYDILEGQIFLPRAMSLSDIQTLLPEQFLKQIKNILINGNHGDFITCRDGLEIIEYLHNSNPTMQIVISTNASGQPDIWQHLGKIPRLKVMFRLDGLEDTHSIYRRYTDYNLILENAKKFIDAGGNAEWTMIRFDHNKHQIESANSLSKQLGFKSFTVVDQGRNTMPVFDRRGNFVRNIGNVNVDIADIKILVDNHQRIVDNHITWHTEIKEKTQSADCIDCKIKQPRQIYIQSNGQVYPCCWTGFWPDINRQRTGNEQIKELATNNNALEVGIKTAIEWFDKLEKTWTIPTVAQGRSYICNETCGVFTDRQ